MHFKPNSGITTFRKLDLSTGTQKRESGLLLPTTEVQEPLVRGKILSTQPSSDDYPLPCDRFRDGDEIVVSSEDIIGFFTLEGETLYTVETSNILGKVVH